MEDYLNMFAANILASIPNILAALIILLAGLYTARLISNLIKRVLQNRSAPMDVTHLLAQVIYWTIAVIAFITALQRFFDVTAFLAGLGIIGFTVGFALQDIMKNFASGVILLIQHPFRVGEAISVAGFDGTVLAINLRTTEMRTFDGRIVLLPNASVLTNSIVNYTQSYRRRVDLPLSVPQDADPDAVRKLVLEAVQGVSGFVDEPAPMVVFHAMTSSTLELTANFWIDVSKNNPPEAKDAALTRVKLALSRAGIEIPHPVQTVYFQRPG